MKTFDVDLGARSYPIFIGGQLLGQPELLAPYIAGHQVVVVSNETVAPLYLDQLKKALVGFEYESVILPDGEQYKTLEYLNTIFDGLLKARCGRDVTLIALGGGVVGDMTGFAAASYQRGVNFIQIPTTVLAQVDSSVGGKTGVNHPLGKNMIGAFHQPQAVLVDTSVLATLDDRQLSAGIAEVIKYGLISDEPFFCWLEENMPRLLARDDEALVYAIERSCRNKAEIVAQDEKEGGIRALLNLGHTFGHAIEAGMGYGKWLHGEAVAVGTCIAADLSRRQGWIDDTAVARIIALTKAANLPTQAPSELSVAKFNELMAVDKKVKAGKLRLILLKGIGNAVVSDDFDADLMNASIDAYRES